jgi:Rod binding domain-containing protein
MDVNNTATTGLAAGSWKEQMLTGGASRTEQMEQLGGEFEGILLRQYLDEALKPMDPENGYFGTGSTPMYEHLIKDSLASSITKSGSLGFSSVLQAQLFPQELTEGKGANSHE